MVADEPRHSGLGWHRSKNRLIDAWKGGVWVFFVDPGIVSTGRHKKFLDLPQQRIITHRLYACGHMRAHIHTPDAARAICRRDKPYHPPCGTVGTCSYARIFTHDDGMVAGVSSSSDLPLVSGTNELQVTAAPARQTTMNTQYVTNEHTFWFCGQVDTSF